MITFSTVSCHTVEPQLFSEPVQSHKKFQIKKFATSLFFCLFKIKKKIFFEILQHVEYSCCNEESLTSYFLKVHKFHTKN